MNQQQRRGIGDELFIEELTLVTGGAGLTTTRLENGPSGIQVQPRTA